MDTQTKRFIRIVNIPFGMDGAAVVIEPLEDKGAKVCLSVQGTILLHKEFRNPKRPKLAFALADSCADRLPPRTTSDCLINEYGFEAIA